MAPHDFQALAHGRVAGRLGRQKRRRKQLQWQVPIPDRSVHGTIGGLILRSEHGFDLFVGLIDRPGAPGFFFAFAAQPQGFFGKTLGVTALDRLTLAFAGHARSHANSPLIRDHFRVRQRCPIVLA